MNDKNNGNDDPSRQREEEEKKEQEDRKLPAANRSASDNDGAVFRHPSTVNDLGYPPATPISIDAPPTHISVAETSTTASNENDGFSETNSLPSPLVFSPSSSSPLDRPNSSRSLFASAASQAFHASTRSFVLHDDQQQQEFTLPPRNSKQRSALSPIPEQEITTNTNNREFVYLTSQVTIFAGTCILSFLAFLNIIFPFSALVAISGSLTSLLAIAWTVRNQLRHVMERTVAGRGVGDYLPEWLFDILTEQSLHEFLTEGNAAPLEQYRHLLIYFLPGLTVEQLNDFVDRLTPSHRNRLVRPGLGNFFGPGFMRILMGEERWNELALHPNNSSIRDGTPARIEVILDHDNSMNMNDNNPQGDRQVNDDDDEINNSWTQQAVGDEDDLYDEEDLPDIEDENDVLTEAFWSAFYGIYCPFQRFFSERMTAALQPVARRSIWSGLGLSAVSTGVALVGYRMGVYGWTVPSMFSWSVMVTGASLSSASSSSSSMRYFPSSRFVWGTAMIGGLCTGTGFLLRHYLSPRRRRGHRRNSSIRPNGGLPPGASYCSSSKKC